LAVVGQGVFVATAPKCGTILYFGMNYEMADAVATYAAETARRLSLVCCDPQTRKLR
jgi:hypothetical protein